MGMRAWISFCFEGKYYTLYKKWGLLECTGERIVELLRQHPNPAEWIALLRKATFIQCLSKDPPEQPSDEIIEAFREYALHGQDLDTNRFLGEMANDSLGLIKYHPDSTIAAMRNILQEPLLFRDFIRNEANKKVPKNPNGWSWLCCDLVCYQRLLFQFLELGFFVFNQEPSSSAPELDLFMEYVYIINLDLGLFSISTCHAPNRLTFKMGSIPWNWRRCLMLPSPWVEAAFAFTPTVTKVLLRELDENFLWRMVLDKFSAGEFNECIGELELVQEYLFNREASDKEIDAVLEEVVIKLGLGEKYLEYNSDDEAAEDRVIAESSEILQALHLELLLHPWIPSPFKENIIPAEHFVSETMKDIASSDEDSDDSDELATEKDEEGKIGVERD